jgi:hypothetical protein
MHEYSCMLYLLACVRLSADASASHIQQSGDDANSKALVCQTTRRERMAARFETRILLRKMSTQQRCVHAKVHVNIS